MAYDLDNRFLLYLSSKRIQSKYSFEIKKKLQKSVFINIFKANACRAVIHSVCCLRRNVSLWGRFQLKEGNSYISWTGK